MSDKEVYTVVQPDLYVICDRSKLDERGCIGAPDLIVEILSKGNSKKEVETKYELYQENGVREYWIVFPYEEVIQQHVLDGEEHYRLRHMYSGDSIATSVIFPQLSFQAAQIFED